MSSEVSETSSADQPEEGIKPLSPAARRRVQSLYEHAQGLITPKKKYDFDYVHTLLGQCVSLDPSNLVYVEAMFDNLHNKFNGNKKAGKTSPKKAALKKHIGKKEWHEALKLGPDALQSNPWDVAVLRNIAEACENMRLNEVELRYLKNALDAAPKDADVNRHCAKSLARMGQFDMAIACWHRVEESNKGDVEAKKAISMLTVEKTRGVLGIDGGRKRARTNRASRALSPALSPNSPSPHRNRKRKSVLGPQSSSRRGRSWNAKSLTIPCSPSLI